MQSSIDVVFRGGTVADGSGGGLYEADIAVSGNRIVAVGEVPSAGREEIDARGMLMTPGFVDIHTHYDGQITWENRLAPSSDHGVTTVVMGNCGVGFAPARAGHRNLMIQLMEGVEDIPEAVMTEGVPWNWESFPDYLDAIGQRESDIDFAAQLPHSPLRVYVMGKRGAELEPPTGDDLQMMRRLTAEAVRAGALGVSSSRQLAHRFRDGRLAPSVNTELDELLALARGLKDAGAGVFQLIPNTERTADQEFDVMLRIAEESGRPLSFSLLQNPLGGADWRVFLARMKEARNAGINIHGQFYPRPIGILFGLDLSYHPFSLHPSFKAISHLPLNEKVAAMRDPEFRGRLLSEEPEDPNPFFLWVVKLTHLLFLLGDPPNYTPLPEESIAARSRASGIPEAELIYDALLELDGEAIIYCPVGNTEGGHFDSPREIFGQPGALLGLGDGGAHYGMICDASYPTFILSQWSQKSKSRFQPPISSMIRALTRDTAEAVGLTDRGQLKVGYKADINLIDYSKLALHAPRVIRNLPAGGKRLSQKATGYAATMVSGVITYRNGEATGALPGRLVRGLTSNSLKDEY